MMIENITSTDHFLYHYTKAEIVLNHILKHRNLRFGNYKYTNDPKEVKSWKFEIGTNKGRDLGKYNMSQLSSWLSSEFKNKTKLACFSTDSSPITGDHFQDIFKRGFCKPRMWVQYAENHTGVCLVFDRKKLLECINNNFGENHLVLSGPVKYVDRRAIPEPTNQQYMINVDHLEEVGKETYVGDHLSTHYSRLFFEKMTDWRDECEYRYVIFSSTENELYLDIKDSLVGIIFGENTAEKSIQEIMELANSWDLDFMGLKWKNCSPWYDYSNPRYFLGGKDLS